MPLPNEVVILANPFSGKGKNRAKVTALAEALADKGLNTRQVWGLGERATLLADPAVGDRFRCVISAGGDGSLAGVINDLSKGGDTTRTAIAMLPMGNENLFAKQFGHNKGIDHLANAIARLETRTTDMGSANGTRFTLMASAGFDADVVQRVDTWRRATQDQGLRRVGRVSYAKPIIKTMTQYRYPSITLIADGGQRVTGAHAFVFNIGKYGGGLPIGSHADCSDGLLDWIVFKRPGLLRLARYGLSTYLKRHLKNRDIAHGKAAEIVMTNDAGPIALQADGDPCGLLPAKITVLPAAMRVVLA